MSATTIAAGLTPEQEQMVLENLPFLNYWLKAKRHTREDEWDDTYQDAFFGLVRAVQLYDPAKGYRFSTYAQNWIKQAITRGRGDLMGVGYRAMLAGRVESWDAPLSLDVTLEGEDRPRLPQTATDDPEHEATTAILAARAVEVMAAICRDELDRAILDNLTAPEPAPSVALAAEHRCSGWAISDRRRRLLAEARRVLGDVR